MKRQPIITTPTFSVYGFGADGVRELLQTVHVKMRKSARRKHKECQHKNCVEQRRIAKEATDAAKEKRTITMGTNVYDFDTKTWSEGEPDFSKGFVAPQEQWDQIGLGKLGKQLIKSKKVVMLLVFALCGFAQGQAIPDAPKPHVVTVDRSLMAADVALRIGDTITTEWFLSDPCKCMVETDPIAPHAASWGKEVAFQAVNALLVIEGARILKAHHHPKLAHLLLAYDVANEGRLVVNNSLLLEKHGTR